jgi:hypothetical protein
VVSAADLCRGREGGGGNGEGSKDRLGRVEMEEGGQRFVTPRVSNPYDYINHMFKRP